MDMQWVVKGALDVDIGANPSAEGGGEDEGVDDQTVRVVDIVDTFRLQVSGFLFHSSRYCLLELSTSNARNVSDDVFWWLQEQPAFDKKQFVTYMKRYIKLLSPKLEGEKQELFKKHIEGATKFLLSKLSDLQL